MDGLICIASRNSEPLQHAPEASEYVHVQTCERSELYALMDSDAINPSLLDAAGSIRIFNDQTAARHLFRVAAGLESRIVGESHVLGQVRRAFAEAESRGTSGAKIAALFRAALRNGKRVQSETSLNANNESVVTLAVRRLEDALERLQGRSVGIVGTGEVGRGVAKALVESEVGSIHVFSRSVARVKQIDWSRSIAHRIEELPAIMPLLDAFVACSKVYQPIIQLPHVELCRDGLSIIDLGAPPNVCKGVAQLPRVSLTRLADFKRTAPNEQVQAAERIVAEELARLDEWLRHRQIADSIERMVREADLPPQRSTPALHARIMQAKAQVAA